MLTIFARNGSIFFRSAIVIALTVSPAGFPIAGGLAQTTAQPSDQPQLRGQLQPAAQSSSTIQPSAATELEIEPKSKTPAPEIEPKDKTPVPWQLFPAVLRPSIQKTSEPDLSTVVHNDLELKAIPAISNLKKYSLVVCTVENRTTIPIIVDADHAVIGDGASIQTTCASQKDLDAIGQPPTTMAQKFKSNLKATIVGAATIGGEQMFEDFKMEKKPVEQRYAYDEQRREHEEDRFGERVLYPGDSTQGNVYFPLPAAEHAGMIISMPVKSFYNGANKAVLSGKIGRSGQVSVPGGAAQRKLDGHG